MGNGTSTSPRRVFLGVLVGLGISAVPFFSKTIREREERVHAMRELSRQKQDEQQATSR